MSPEPARPDPDRLTPDPALLRSLREAQVVGAEQERLRQEMVEFAHTHEDSLLRTCDAGHFTGSALVVHPDTREILLLLHTKAQLWLQPGGHADGQADLAAVALREATEETGIDGLEVVGPAIDLDRHTFRPPAGPPHIHLDVRFLVLAPSDARVLPNHESEDIRWVGIEDLGAYGVDPGLERMARSGLRVLGR